MSVMIDTGQNAQSGSVVPHPTAGSCEGTVSRVQGKEASTC